MRNLDDPWEEDVTCIIEDDFLDDKYVVEFMALINDRKKKIIFHSFTFYMMMQSNSQIGHHNLRWLINKLKKIVTNGRCEFTLRNWLVVMNVHKGKFCCREDEPALQIGKMRYFFNKNESIDWKSTKNSV